MLLIRCIEIYLSNARDDVNHLVNFGSSQINYRGEVKLFSGARKLRFIWFYKNGCIKNELDNIIFFQKK